MITTGHLNFFKIKECGLYKHGSDQSMGCGIDETFSLIADWVRGKPLAETIPWDPVHTRTGHSKCYCQDLYKCDTTGEYLFVLWKSDTDSAGTLLGAQEAATTGSGKIVEFTNNYKGTKMIWGRPCYYWVIPKMQTIVSMKFDHSVCDSQLLQEWVTSCINNKVKHENKIRHNTETGLIRFTFTDGTASGIERYAYRFDVGLRSMNTASAELMELATRVTHIIRRETIRLNGGVDDRASWVKFFDKVPHLNTKPKAKSRQIEIKAEAKPTAHEIKEIIESFAKSDRKQSDWDNVGFETDKGTIWIDKYRLRALVNLNQEDGKIFSAVDLHLKVSKEKSKLLDPLVRSLKSYALPNKKQAEG